ncbi:MAG: O-antigen ligase family protein, partial [Bacteroidia bacterium]
YLYFTTGEAHFYYESLAWFQHPSYLAMYITFCCVALLLKPIFTKLLSFIGIVFFTLFVLLLSSKTGIVIHFGLLVFCIASLFLKRKNYLKAFGIAFFGALVFCIGLFFIPAVKQRFEGAFISLQTNNLDKNTTESTAVRRLIWNEATQIIKQNLWFGVSPGDANDALYNSYQQNGLTAAYAKKLNAHSQYFQTGVGLGLVGLISLLVLFITPLFENRKKLVLFFVLITALNFLTESILQTMAGSIFLGYFYSVICFKHDSIFATKD